MPSVRPALWVAVLLLLAAAAGVATSTSHVIAGVLGWNTTTVVLPGETLTVDVTQPGVNIGATSIFGQCPVTGLTTNIITYTCTYIGLGIPVGTQMVQEWTDPNGKPLAGPFSETVTYNGGPSIPVASSPPTPCTNNGVAVNPATGATLDPDFVNWTCNVNVLQTQYPQTLTVDLLASDQSLLLTSLQGMTIDNPGQNGTTVVLSPYDALGTCDFDTVNSTPTFVEYVNDYWNPEATSTGYPGELIGGQQWGSEIKAVYNCQSGGQSIPIPGGSSSVQTLGNGSSSPNNGSTLTIGVITSSSAMLDTAQFVTYAQPPTPTTQTVLGPAAPLLTSISPTSGPPGTTVTLSGTGLIAQVITFGANPGHETTVGPDRGTRVQFGQATEQADVCSSDGMSCTATVPGGA